jgi:hypothetical protein
MAIPQPVSHPAPSVLGRAHPSDVKTAPYAHIVVDQALPAAEYELFAESFPPLEAFVGDLLEVPENNAVRLELHQAEARRVLSETWREFFTYHMSVEFWRDIVRVFGPQLRAAHPDLERRIGRPMEQWRAKPRGAPEEAEVALSCQFVVNTPTSATTSVKPAHIDRADKIFAGLFYMRRPDDDSTGAGLQLFRHRGKPIFDKHETPWSSVTQTDCLPFAANRFIGFVNSDQSVHAVEPRTPSPVPRRYINIIAELPNTRAFKPPQMGKVRRMIYRNFQRPPRRTIGMED